MSFKIISIKFATFYSFQFTLNNSFNIQTIDFQMLSISKEAQDFVMNQKSEKIQPAIVVFERTYSSWCGPRTYTGVQVHDEKELREYEGLEEMKKEGIEFPIFIEPKLQSKLKSAQIDLTGFGAFKRLALIV
jgi:hypothetical protein